MAQAIDHAGALFQPEQQALPDALAGPLAAGLAAWEGGQAAAAGNHLAQALAAAQRMNYT